jgi:hypothetical protein
MLRKITNRIIRFYISIQISKFLRSLFLFSLSYVLDYSFSPSSNNQGSHLLRVIILTQFRTTFPPKDIGYFSHKHTLLNLLLPLPFKLLKANRSHLVEIVQYRYRINSFKFLLFYLLPDLSLIIFKYFFLAAFWASGRI